MLLAWTAAISTVSIAAIVFVLTFTGRKMKQDPMIRLVAFIVIVMGLPNVIVVAHLTNAEDEYSQGYEHGLKDGINSERGDPVG